MLLVALVYYISHSFIHSWYDMIWFDWFVIWKTKYKIPAIQTWTLDHYYYWSGIKFYIVALVVVNEKLQKKNFFFWIFPFRFLFHSFISLSETNQDFFFLIYSKHFDIYHWLWIVCVRVCKFAIPIRFATNHCIKRNEKETLNKKSDIHWNK